MNMNWKWMALAAASMLASWPVWAQDNAPAADAPAAEVYSGNTFSLTQPANWLLVSGNLSDKKLAKLPENVREHYNQRNTDVIFMDVPSADADPKGFKDSLNIVTLSEKIPVSDSLIKELKPVLEQQYGQMFDNSFKLESSEISTLPNVSDNVYVLKGSYTVLNYQIVIHQYLVPGNNESLVLTCTIDSGSENAEANTKKCLDAVNTIVIK